MTVQNNPKRGFRSGREMTACLSCGIFLGILVTAVQINSDSTAPVMFAFLACVTVGGLGGWAWQHWGRERFPLKAHPMLRPSKMFQQPSG